jgi:DNA-binding transcriptional LysR family regulator
MGRAVADAASPIDHVVAQVVDVAVGESEGALHGSLRVLAPDGFGATFVVPAVDHVLRRHPHLSVELITATRPLSPRGSGFDIAVTIGVPTSPALVSEKLTDYTLGLYASSAYLAEHGPIMGTEALVGLDLIYYVDSMLTVADLDLRQDLNGMEVRFSSTNILAQLSATRAGVGIGLLPAFLAESEPNLIAVLPEAIRYTLEIGLSARRESAGLDAVGVMRSALLREVHRRVAEILPDSSSTC